MQFKIIRKKFFYDPVFGFQVIVRLETFIKDNKSATAQHEEHKTHQLIRLTRINYDDLVHECIHLVSAILTSCNISTNLENDSNQEIFAYYHSYWVVKIWKIIKKWKKNFD